MFKSLQILTSLHRNSELYHKQKRKPEPLKFPNPNRNKKKPQDNQNDKSTVQGKKFNIARKSCNVQYNLRFSQKIQIKMLNTPKKFQIKKKQELIVDQIKQQGTQRESTATIKREDIYPEESNQNEKTTNKKQFFKQEKEQLNLRDQFKSELAKCRRNNQIDLKKKYQTLKLYNQQRQNFLNYLAYLIYYVNQEEKDCDQKTEVKLQTFFKAVQIFDNYLCIQEKKLEQSQIFTTTQTCILIASKLQDIYYIDINQIEFNESCQQKIYIQEKCIVEELDYKLYYTTELDFLFDYIDLFKVNNSEEKKILLKNSLLNLLIIIRDIEIRQLSCDEISQGVLAYTYMQLFPQQLHFVEHLIIHHQWPQHSLQQATLILQHNLSQQTHKYIDNIHKVIDYI